VVDAFVLHKRRTKVGYYVRALSLKKKAPQWKVQFVSYKKTDFHRAEAVKPKKEWDVDKDRWRSLGFHKSMTTVEARCRARQLNSQLFIKRQEERIRKIETKRIETLKRHQAVLPEEFVAEFEVRFVRSRDSDTDAGKRRRTRAFSLWQAAQRMIAAVGVEPSDWFYHTLDINDYFHQRKYSVRYIHSTLKMANLWGFFICRKMGRPFLPIPIPRGYERQRLIQAYYEKERKSRQPSRPLAPELLKSRYRNLNRGNYHWLLLSVWFGLRPQEVDNLRDDKMWSVEKLGNGRRVLWVFQTKIIALPIEDRWKPIPILFSEQEFAVRILKEKSFKRPIMKTMRKHFGKGIDLYAGRKGFADLMLAKGHSLENISVWMGHSTLERTWKSYKDRRRYHLNY